jgi:hypothetical protein
MESSQIELFLRQMLQEVTGEERRWGRSQSQKRHHQPWDELMQTLDDATFCHMFGMTRATFSVLCTTIEEKVGEEVFKSELWLSCREVPPPGSKVKDCAFYPVGGLIFGEMKIAIMIRILSGASYLDVLFGYCVASCYEIQLGALTMSKSLRVTRINHVYDAIVRN